MNIFSITVSYLDNFTQLKPILYNVGKGIQPKKLEPFLILLELHSGNYYPIDFKKNSLLK